MNKKWLLFQFPISKIYLKYQNKEHFKLLCWEKCILKQFELFELVEQISRQKASDRTDLFQPFSQNSEGQLFRPKQASKWQ